MSRWALDQLTPEQRKQVEAKLRQGVTIRSADSNGGRRVEMPAPKFHNKRVVYDGYTFDSIKEANRWRELRYLQAAKEITKLERQVSFELNLYGIELCVYIADFAYRNKAGERVVEDVKGMRHGTVYRLFKIKAALMLALHKIKVVEI